MLVLLVGFSLPSPTFGGTRDSDVLIPDARALWVRSLAVQRLRTVRGEAILRTARRSGYATRLDIRFVAKVGPDGWGRLLVSRIESGGPLQGSSFLTLERKDATPTQWLYLPALGSPRRISSRSRGDGYFGSEFTHAGLLQPRLNDFDVRLVGQEAIGQIPCWKLEAIPKNTGTDVADRGRLLLWIRQDNTVERRVVYHDETGRPLKVMNAHEVIPVAGDGKWMALERSMHNLRSGTFSVVAFSNIETGIDVDDKFFSPQYLSMQLW